MHEVRFVSYPKLLFIWPLILAGLVLWPFGKPPAPQSVAGDAPAAAAVQPAESTDASDANAASTPSAAPVSGRLETLAWIYIWSRSSCCSRWASTSIVTRRSSGSC